MSTKDMRKITEISINELQEVLDSNLLPDDVSLDGLEERKDFDKLFKHRLTPRLIAKTLLKEKISQNILSEPVELKEKRLDIKKQELALKEKRLEKQTWQLNQIWNAISRLEKKIDILLTTKLTKEGGE